jgi:cystathionine beta-lyase/cystathionine gamma-synthase
MNLTEILTHLGEEREAYFNSVAPPIMQSSNFTYKTFDEFRRVLKDEVNNPLYTRGCNPTVAILRKKLAALEGSEDALVFSSGSAACSAAVIANVKAGDHIVCVQKPYSWTYKLLTQFLSRFGVEYSFVDGTDPENFRKAIRPNTTLMFLESPNSISFELQDIAACVKIAKEYNLVTVCDNSYCSPLFQNPIAMGVDIVTHSGTKYINGHSDVVAGVLCASKEMVDKIFYSEYMTLGTNISPNDAWLVLRGLRTLPLRIQRSQESAMKVVAYLEQHPKVEQVVYPWSKSHPQYELAQKQMKGAGGLFSVIFKAKDLSTMEKFCEAMAPVFLMAVSWGGYESLQVPTALFYKLDSLGDAPSLPFTMVRYYAGLEDPEIMIAAFEKALEMI